MKKASALLASAVLLGLTFGTQAVNADTVTVQAGDTVSEIAHEHGTTVSDIVKENSLSNPNLIFVGDKLEVSGNATITSQAASSYVQVPSVKTEQPKVEQSQPAVTSDKTTTYSTPKAQKQSTQPQQVAQPQQSLQPQQSSQGAQSSVMSKTSGQLSQSEINQVAGEMASRTGESASTWNMIVNRESKGNVDVSNSEGSGAHGLFQLMRSSHGNVGAQINEAVQLYQAQGLQAWSQTAY